MAHYLISRNTGKTVHILARAQPKNQRFGNFLMGIEILMLHSFLKSKRPKIQTETLPKIPGPFVFL
jgi:hypothetical protein